MSWDDAIDEIAATPCCASARSRGPTRCTGWARPSTASEQSYLIRKFAAYWGTNNVDHQAPHLPFDDGRGRSANTWGYGAMTNSYNDMHNCKAMIFVGSNPAEAHPVAMQHILRAKENGAKMIVCDPALHPHRAHADLHVQLRPGSDVGLMWGMLWHVFENGWEDKEYIRQRVYGMDEIREEVKKWTPEETLRVTGVPGETMKAAAQMMAENAPAHRVVHGRDAAHHRNNNTRRVLRACSSRSATSASPAAARTSSAAMTTCRARRTSVSSRIPSRATTG